MTDEGEFVRQSSSYVPVDWVPITPGEEHRPLRAIRANTEGTVTVTMGNSTDRVLNFLAGETRYGMFDAVTAATATGLEGGV